MKPVAATPALDLHDLALEIGASVRRKDGSVFNAGGRAGASRIPRLAAVPAAPAASPPSALPAAPVPDELTQKLLASLQDFLARPAPVMPEIRMPDAPAPNVVIQAPQRKGCTFKFKRNPDGSIDEITATFF